MKPSPSDYLPFLEAARGHEANARASGSLVDAELARLMYAEATRLRLEALYPPERCVECPATIHSHEMKCSACGRARQGVKLGTRHVVNLLRFVQGYDFDAAERHLSDMKAAAQLRSKASRARQREARKPDTPRGIEVAREIRRLHQAGARLVDMAEQFSLSTDQIRKIVKGRSWPEPGPCA